MATGSFVTQNYSRSQKLTFLNLKQYSVWSGQQDLLILISDRETLGRRFAARSRPLDTVQNLEIQLRQEWNSMPQSLTDNLIASMLNSCAEV
ncbi:hypothetical protein TNCV_2170031 [Trichonephila clavipes]|nr:hypothetical protein TNCV_2170031 [Trichonephila clavipes]